MIQAWTASVYEHSQANLAARRALLNDTNHPAELRAEIEAIANDVQLVGSLEAFVRADQERVADEAFFRRLVDTVSTPQRFEALNNLALLGPGVRSAPTDTDADETGRNVRPRTEIVLPPFPPPSSPSPPTSPVVSAAPFAAGELDALADLPLLDEVDFVDLTGPAGGSSPPSPTLSPI